MSLSTSGDIWLTLLVLIGTVAAVIWLVRPVPGSKTPSARELAGRFEMVRAMSGRQLEIFVAELFGAMATG